MSETNVVLHGDRPIILKEGKEIKTHGSNQVPYAIYHCSIPEVFPSYPLHYHEEFEIIHCNKGKGLIQISGEDFIIDEGESIMILPNKVHSISSIEEPFNYFNILFKFSLLETNENSIAYQRYFLPFIKGDIEINNLIKKDEEIWNEITPPIDELIEKRSSLTLLKIKSCIYNILDVLFRNGRLLKKEEINDKTNSFLKDAVKYIDDHYNEKIKMDDVANICGYSTSHFMRLFKEITGTSFSQYVIHFRIERAAELLRTTSKTILEIANSCGFFNPSYFTRTFIQQYQLTPSRYREQKSILNKRPIYGE